MRRALQVGTAIVGLVPLVTGILGFYYGARGPLYSDAETCRSVLLDSNLRYFHGMWLGAGLATFWMIPRIERETSLFRAIWLMVFLGALGRITAMLAYGPPANRIFLLFGVVELVGAPVFVVWQQRVARAAGAGRSAGGTAPAVATVRSA